MNYDQINTSLKKTDIHIWHLPILDYKPNFLILSQDELEKGETFHSEKDQNHYWTCRTLLRIILSKYAQIRPEHLKFGYTDRGKPYLIQSINISFNLSHKSEMGVLAICLDSPIGVDIEAVEPIEECLTLADQFFSVQEASKLRALKEEKTLQAFYYLWTSKEAYVKGLGDGLSHPLDDFTIPIPENIEAKPIQVPIPETKWRIHSYKFEKAKKDYFFSCASPAIQPHVTHIKNFFAEKGAL